MDKPTATTPPLKNAARKSIALVSLISGLLFALLQACSTAVEEESVKTQQGFTGCDTQRPEMCTREYQPVCGHVDTGIRCVTTPCPSERHKTYGNACSACADDKVIGFEQGTCESYGK